MSTRRADAWSFDHGAQYFTVRDARFRDAVDSWRRLGLVARWNGRTAVLADGRVTIKPDATERWVAVPGMNALCRHLVDGLEVRFSTRVTSLVEHGGRWRVLDADASSAAEADVVVVSAPAPQAAQLLTAVAPIMADRVAQVEMAPCWAVMAGFPEPLDLGFDGGFVAGSPLNWVARNGSKPGRPEAEAWILHGSPEWSRENLELEADVVAIELLDAFARAAGTDELHPEHLVAHRWRFAVPPRPLQDPCVADAELRLLACGDWCNGPRVEGAFLSGRAAAERVLEL
jgi:predicted NAD/FAD-dependent oxidoreductase